MAQRTLRHHLRETTREVHEELHALQGFHALSVASITREEFRWLMAGMGHFYKALDGRMITACRAHSGSIAGYQYHCRAPLFSEGTTREIELPKITGPATLAGAAYVVDGAVLGGRILGAGPLSFARHPYWDWCASEGPKVWRGACSLLDHLERAGTEHAAVVQGAQAMFEAFRDAMLNHMERAPA